MTYRNLHTRYITLAILLLLCPSLFFASCNPNSAIQLKKLNKEGQALFNASKYNAAIMKWQQAIKLPATKPPSLYLNMAESWLRISKPDKAKEIIKKAQIFYPKNEELILTAARIQIINVQPTLAEKTLKRLKNSTPWKYILHGDILSIQGQLATAEPAYQKAIDLKPSPEAFVRLALCRLGRHDDKGAQASYDMLTSSVPNDPKIINQMGIFWRLKGDYPKAEFFLRKAMNLDPGNLLLRKSLAEFFFVNNQLKKAAATIVDATKSSPTSPSLNNLLIEILLKQNKLPEAAVILKKLTNNGVKNIPFHLLQGKYFLLNKQPYLAISQFSEVIKNEPRLPISHYLLALTYVTDQRLGLAEQSAIEALSLNPYFSEAELLLADIYYHNGQYSQSLEHIDRIIAREPENFRPQLLKGYILLAQRQYKQADNNFKLATILKPSLPYSRLGSALALEHVGDTKKAASIYLKISQTNPDIISASQRYIALLQKHKSKDEEITNFISSLPPDIRNSPDFLNMLGKTYLEDQKAGKALSFFQKTIQLDIHKAEAYMGLANIYKMRHKWPQFTEILRRCVTNNPVYIPAILKLSKFYDDNDQILEAKILIENSLKQAPDSPYLANSLAWLLLEENSDIDRAFILAQKSYEKLPDNPAIIDTLGWAYYKKKIFTRAEWLLEEALQKSPEQPTIHLHLGQTLLAKGKNKKALKYLKATLELNPTHKQRDIAQKLILAINQHETK